MKVLLYLVVGLLCTTSKAARPNEFEFKHHNNKELVDILNNVHRKCPTITRVYNLKETSVLGQPLTLIEFAKHPGVHKILIPEFKSIANMHGNEVLGREVLLKLADHLCDEYLLGNVEIRMLIQMTRIHLWPSMNPDGWDAATAGMKLQDNPSLGPGRHNANDIDLNRNFPDLNKIAYERENTTVGKNYHFLDDVECLPPNIQPETYAALKLIMNIPSVLSCNLHGGDLVVSYPYDTRHSGTSNKYSKSPDDKLFRHLASVYAINHADMTSKNKEACIGGYNFGEQGGITNGAEWYSLSRGMQDVNYFAANGFEVTIEMGCNKYTLAEDLENEWHRNRNAMIKFIWQTHIGIKGVVYNAKTGELLSDVVIHVIDITDGRQRSIDHDVTTGCDGDYFRLLTDGSYIVTAHLINCMPHQRRVTVINDPKSGARRLDFKLTCFCPTKKQINALTQS